MVLNTPTVLKISPTVLMISPMVLHTHYTGWFCEGMFRLEESQMFSFEIHTGWISYKSFEIYTGWKSYKIQGDCQVFSLFKKLFIFRGGLSWVPWGMFSTVGDIMMHMGGYHEYRGGVFSTVLNTPTVLHTHYTGWKSYKIQGDCQVFSIFKKLFIFRDRCSPIYKFEWNIWWTRTTVKLKYLP